MGHMELWRADPCGCAAGQRYVMGMSRGCAEVYTNGFS